MDWTGFAKILVCGGASLATVDSLETAIAQLEANYHTDMVPRAQQLSFMLASRNAPNKEAAPKSDNGTYDKQLSESDLIDRLETRTIYPA